MLSYGLPDEKQAGFFWRKRLFSVKNLWLQKIGRHKGYPMRTYYGVIYNGDYSEHFPIYAEVIKAVKN